MRVLTANLTSQKNTIRSDSAWVWLLRITVETTTPTILYYTNNIKDITFDGHTWTHKNMKVGSLKADSQGNLDSWQISIENVDRILIAYLESGQLIDQPILALVVNSELLSDSDDQIPFRTFITKAAGNEETVTLHCGFYDLRRIKIPRAYFSKLYCRHAFKRRYCQYGGGAASCDKRLVTCRLLGNEINFGGFVGMPLVHR